MKHDFRTDVHFAALLRAWITTQADGLNRAAYTEITTYLNRLVFRMHDVTELTRMLGSLQNCEMTVSRARELIDMWVGGNYNDSMLPEPEPEIPYDAVAQIAALKARIKELEAPKQKPRTMLSRMERIQAYREKHGCPLMEAKTAIDQEDQGE